MCARAGLCPCTLMHVYTHLQTHTHTSTYISARTCTHQVAPPVSFPCCNSLHSSHNRGLPCLALRRYLVTALKGGVSQESIMHKSCSTGYVVAWPSMCVEEILCSIQQARWTAFKPGGAACACFAMISPARQESALTL